MRSTDERASYLRLTLVVSALALAFLAQLFLRYGAIHWAVAPLLVAAGCLALDSIRPAAAPGRDDLPVGPEPLVLSLRLFGFRLSAPEAGWLMVAAACLLMAVALRNFGLSATGGNLTVAWYSFGLAAALLAGGIAVCDGRAVGFIARARRGRGLEIGFSNARHWLVLAVILACAAAVRLHDLDIVPAGFWHDEAQSLAIAVDYAGDPGSIPVYETAGQRPSLFFLPMAALVDFFGASVVIPRLVAAVFGVGLVGATYLLARRALGSPSAGLIAAALAAMMRWEVNFSRIGFDATAGAMFAALAGWLTLRAVGSGRTGDHALAGLALGMGMWFYISNQLFLVVVAFAMVHHWVVNRTPFRRLLANGLALGLVALFVSAPLVQFAVSDPDSFFLRSRQVSLFHLEPREVWGERVLEGLGKHALMFNRQGDPNPRHNLPHAPTLDDATAALFVLGFVFMLTRWRSTSLLVLPFWTVLMVMPGVLTAPWEAPQSLRSALVMPAACVLAAYPLHRLLKAFGNSPYVRLRAMAVPTVAAVLVVIGLVNVDFYFNRQAADPRVYGEFSTDQFLIAQSRAAEVSRGYTLWSSRHYLPGMMDDLVGVSPQVRVVSPPQGLPLDAGQVASGAAMHFEPRERGYWELAREYYPDGRFSEITAPGGGRALYYTAFIDRGSVEWMQGLRVSYVDDGGVVREADGPLDSSVWHATYGLTEFPYEVVLDGSVRFADDRERVLVWDGNVEAEVYMDDVAVLDTDRREVVVRAGAGMHSLLVRIRAEGPDDFLALKWAVVGNLPVPMGRGDLFRGSVRSMGMAGRFVRQVDGEAVLRISPSMDVFDYHPVVGGRHLATYEGRLMVERPGEYEFLLDTHSGPVRLYVDGVLAAQEPGGDLAPQTARLDLPRGRVGLRVEHEAEGSGSVRFTVLWRPPGGEFVPIPPAAIVPSGDALLRIVR